MKSIFRKQNVNEMIAFILIIISVIASFLGFRGIGVAIAVVYIAFFYYTKMLKKDK